MADDNRWNDRDRDWRDDRGWQEGRGRERGGYGARGGRDEGPAGYNPAGPVQGGWSFGEPGHERHGRGRGAFGQPDYDYGPYTPYGAHGRDDYDTRGRGGRGERGGEDRSWLERAGERVSHLFSGDTDGGEHRGRGPRGYKRSDDRIREDLNDRLTDDAWLDASTIEVEVSACEVTLSGTVRSRDDKRRAENLAETVSGVTHVQNNLRADQVADADTGGIGVNTARNTTLG